MMVSVIVACSQNWVIGRDGDMPWRLSADLKRFKALTMGHAMIMGRKTYDSIGRLLPGRETIILTRQTDFEVEGAEVVHKVDQALAIASRHEHLFVVGGAEIYQLMMPHAERLFLTLVHTRIEDGDTFFSPPNFFEWKRIHSEEFPADEKNQYPTRFEEWHRTGAN